MRFASAVASWRYTHCQQVFNLYWVKMPPKKGLQLQTNKQRQTHINQLISRVFLKCVFGQYFLHPFFTTIGSQLPRRRTTKLNWKSGKRIHFYWCTLDWHFHFASKTTTTTTTSRAKTKRTKNQPTTTSILHSNVSVSWIGHCIKTTSTLDALTTCLVERGWKATWNVSNWSNE